MSPLVLTLGIFFHSMFSLITVDRCLAGVR
jgi:hypothetical protein